MISYEVPLPTTKKLLAPVTSKSVLSKLAKKTKKLEEKMKKKSRKMNKKMKDAKEKAFKIKIEKKNNKVKK
uniref:Uncharacterized protein n=1 Tax=Strongyloides stercoralis TaxID=6248 RepID=A0A0K0EB99_STRER